MIQHFPTLLANQSSFATGAISMNQSQDLDPLDLSLLDFREKSLYGRLHHGPTLLEIYKLMGEGMFFLLMAVLV